MNNNQLVFQCVKCGHLTFVSTTNKSALSVGKRLIDYDCPSCGETGSWFDGVWTFVRFGNFEKEYGKCEK